MARLVQLADGDGYRACDWDLQADAAGRAYWDGVFRWHVDDVLLPLIREEYGPTDEQAAAFRADYLAMLDEINVRAERYARLDILFYTEVRDALLARHGFDDPFRGIKQRENEVALELLPAVLVEVDAAAPAERLDLLVSGLVAGNIFDLGAAATVRRHRNGDAAFRQTRASLPPRPWLRDDVAAWRRRWEAGPAYRHVVFFVDNCGSDIVLGCLPLVRWMLAGGARVTLAANSKPTLNDVTAAELGPLLQRVARLDAGFAAALAEGRLRAAASGGTQPLIDLTRLTPDFVAATADADLLLLHGMGRAIESNFHAHFTCDTLWSAVVKDKHVAARIGGDLFGCVFRFAPRLAG
jgi:damage-control phosphatase, subfamily II, stand-alone protein